MPNTESNEPTIMFLGGKRAAQQSDSRELKVKEYAEREQVDERTVWRWIAKGAVTVRRTPGGGVRIKQG
jgi:hypothetical protein